MTPKKQIRCINCNNIIAVGHIKEGIIEIDCRHCKTKNRVEAVVENAVDGKWERLIKKGVNPKKLEAMGIKPNN